MTLRDKDILLAGGCGGIGLGVAELLEAEGARLLLSYRSRDCEGRFPAIQADLTHAEDRKRLLDAMPGLYGLVVLAGEPARVREASELEPAVLRSCSVNYAGPILLAREAADRMRAAGVPGAIVLTGTMQAVAPFPNTTAYAAAKAALVYAARILALECRGGANIRVNVVSPGVTAAGMAQASIASGKYDRYIQEGVIPRFGRAEDVARAVRFFLEPDNYVTGQVLCVDGGMTLDGR